ncbi:antitoxin Xre/MbcA/ParS toxin-binding domain-containing protein [Pseudomonas sp. LS-2]|uniref:antitoxin Xre/MbcA/ParS toxin-binding domain-containing protein n=1 Tax=Pseudomonas sp. LS-2 TaxID=2315859 RepID=UPI0035C822D2
MLKSATPARIGCLSNEYRCFTSAQIQVLSRATLILGPPRASKWFVSRIRSLDRRQPCTLIHNALGFALVMDVLTQLEHGIF